MEEFHAVIVDKSLVNVDILEGLKVLSVKGGDWTLYKISVNENELIEVIKLVQSQMNDGAWYFHFYNRDGSRLMVVFKYKVFETNNNPATWSDILAYGEELGVPSGQLDFIPNRFEDEIF